MYRYRHPDIDSNNEEQFNMKTTKQITKIICKAYPMFTGLPVINASYDRIELLSSDGYLYRLYADYANESIEIDITLNRLKKKTVLSQPQKNMLLLKLHKTDKQLYDFICFMLEQGLSVFNSITEYTDKLKNSKTKSNRVAVLTDILEKLKKDKQLCLLFVFKHASGYTSIIRMHCNAQGRYHHSRYIYDKQGNYVFKYTANFMYTDPAELADMLVMNGFTNIFRDADSDDDYDDILTSFTDYDSDDYMQHTEKDVQNPVFQKNMYTVISGFVV